MIFLRKFSFYLALAGVISASLLVARLRAQYITPTREPVVAPAPKPSPAAVAASGLVEAARENTQVGVPVAGLVTRVFVQPWDHVEAGQPLLQLDGRELRAQLLTQRAQVTVAESTLQRLRDQLTRLESVTDPRAVSQEEVKTRRDDVAVATAQLESSRAAVEQTEALTERLCVRAPIAGSVLQVNIRVGEYAAPGGKAPILLGDTATLQVRADVDEQIAPRVRAGMPATGYLKGDPARPIELQFVRIEPFVVPKTSLTGASNERVDTRVLQVIYAFAADPRHPCYVGQQMDLFLHE